MRRIARIKRTGEREDLRDSTSGFQLHIPIPTPPPPIASSVGFASLLIAVHWKWHAENQIKRKKPQPRLTFLKHNSFLWSSLPKEFKHPEDFVQSFTCKKILFLQKDFVPWVQNKAAEKGLGLGHQSANLGACHVPNIPSSVPAGDSSPYHTARLPRCPGGSSPTLHPGAAALLRAGELFGGGLWEGCRHTLVEAVLLYWEYTNFSGLEGKSKSEPMLWASAQPHRRGCPSSWPKDRARTFHKHLVFYLLCISHKYSCRIKIGDAIAAGPERHHLLLGQPLIISLDHPTRSCFFSLPSLASPLSFCEYLSFCLMQRGTGLPVGNCNHHWGYLGYAFSREELWLSTKEIRGSVNFGETELLQYLFG